MQFQTKRRFGSGNFPVLWSVRGQGFLEGSCRALSPLWYSNWSPHCLLLTLGQDSPQWGCLSRKLLGRSVPGPRGRSAKASFLNSQAIMYYNKLLAKYNSHSIFSVRIWPSKSYLKSKQYLVSVYLPFTWIKNIRLCMSSQCRHWAICLMWVSVYSKLSYMLCYNTSCEKESFRLLQPAHFKFFDVLTNRRQTSMTYSTSLCLSHIPPVSPTPTGPRPLWERYLCSAYLMLHSQEPINCHQAPWASRWGTGQCVSSYCPSLFPTIRAFPVAAAHEMVGMQGCDVYVREDSFA